jgi:putative RNA 2'-phosphotransferase
MPIISRTQLSKLLSLVLRHKPGTIGITLDEQGWALVDELIKKINEQGHFVTRDMIDEVVAQNDKKRFSFDETGIKIRASQGHSIEVDLQLTQQTPPAILYHGTVEEFILSIRQKGLLKMNRHHVHLSQTIETARQVGSRRGKPVILIIKAAEMVNDGFIFYISENGVWLTDAVPPEYIDFDS